MLAEGVWIRVMIRGWGVKLGRSELKRLCGAAED